MTAREAKKPRFAICLDNTVYPASLELHKVYRIVSDAKAEAEGDLRVIDESGEDYLFQAAYFMEIEVPDARAKVLSKSFAGRA